MPYTKSLSQAFEHPGKWTGLKRWAGILFRSREGFPVMAMHAVQRGSLFHLLDDLRFNQDCVEFIEDGVLLVSDGAIISAGPAKEILDKLPAGTDIIHHNDAVLVPGFFDLHATSWLPTVTSVA